MADLTEDDVENAIAELAAERGIGITELSEQVLMLTGGERDSVSRAQAVVELANMPGDEAAALVGLAAKGKKKGWDEDDPDEEDETEEDDGDEDIHESEHQGQRGTGYEGPKPKRPARKKRATKPVRVKRRGQSPFGGEGGAPEGGAGATGGAMAASAPRRALVRAGDGTYGTIALSEDEVWADEEVARLQAEHADARVGLSAPAFDTPNDLGGPQKYFDFDVYDTGTVQDDQTKPSDELLSEVQRYLWIHESMSKPKAYGSVRKGKLAGRYPGTGPSGKPQNVR